jgi:penicillin-binding protein 2
VAHVFARRLHWLAFLLLLVVGALTARLVDIQVVHAHEYEALLDRLLLRPPVYLRAPRGSILDRQGRLLVSDAPAFDICVHYDVITGRRRYVEALAARRELSADASGRDVGPVADAIQRQIDGMWSRLGELTSVSERELRDRAQRTRERVERIREEVARRTGVDQPIDEERVLHPLVQGVDEATALAVQLEFRGQPWLAVEPGTRRAAAREADALVHVLGRLGSATPERIAEDPLRGDGLRELRPGDLCGVSGVERVADTVLRGTRGRVVEDFSGRVLETAAAQVGHNAALTIDLDIQTRVLEILGDAVDHAEHPAGGSAVVIDAATREVLALVSYPIYSYDAYSSEYERLAADARWLPLRLRAVADHYPPGSTCKAITLVGALSESEIGENERIHCDGHLLPNDPTKFRCWIYNQYSTTHDASQPEGQNAEDAIRNSCNIYFFRAGERLGPQRLCDWFGRFGLGRTQGIGLIEESPGIVPTGEWLMATQGRRLQTADAWNYSIGQGEVTATPLQSANVAATIATGVWAPVRLVRDEDGAWLGGGDAQSQPFDERALNVLRRGMWRVVNEDGGTARTARLDLSEYELCGKTGSAQAVPRVITRLFTLEWPDGRRETVVAGTEAAALERAARGSRAGAEDASGRARIVGSVAHERFPAWQPGEKLPSHAWFIGFTQPRGTRRGAAPQGRCYAVSVLIEYGGSGGRVAGPVAKRIVEAILAGKG